jgi:hypothetical protein
MHAVNKILQLKYCCCPCLSVQIIVKDHEDDYQNATKTIIKKESWILSLLGVVGSSLMLCVPTSNLDWLPKQAASCQPSLPVLGCTGTVSLVWIWNGPTVPVPAWYSGSLDSGWCIIIKSFGGVVVQVELVWKRLQCSIFVNKKIIPPSVMNY